MISKDKQYRTRDGREVRIYAVDGIEDYPVHAAVKGERGWKSDEYTIYGKSLSWEETEDDLIEYDPKAELLEEAKRRGYCEGVEVRWPLGGTGVISSDIRYDEGWIMASVKVGNEPYSDRWIYDEQNDRWAEIVKEELSIEERLERIENKLNIK